MPNWAGSDIGSGPPQYAKAVTPSDATKFTFGYCRALYAAGAGNIVAIMKDEAGADLAVTFAFAAGEIKPIPCCRVNNTNTTATGIVALW